VELGDTVCPKQICDAFYFVDLTLMEYNFHKFKKSDLVEAIVLLTTVFRPNQNFDFTALDIKLREPALWLFFMHLKLQKVRANTELMSQIVDKPSSGEKENAAMWIAVSCQHGKKLSETWQHASGVCNCRICQTNIKK